MNARSIWVTTFLVVAVASWSMVAGSGCGGEVAGGQPATSFSMRIEQEAAGIGSPEDPAVFVKEGLDTFHKSNCVWLVRGKPGNVEGIAKSQALDEGFTPCDECMTGQ